MNYSFQKRILHLAAASFFFLALSSNAAPPIPETEVSRLQEAFDNHQKATSDARKRLALKRVTRDAKALLKAHPDAPNRFEILALVFQAQKILLGLDQSPRTRTALLETARDLARAPDAQAVLRLDAELLLTQSELARKGEGAKARMRALRPMLERYQGTPAESKMLRIALVMTLEVGDQKLLTELRETISRRFPGDLEMITFLREKLGGQIFGAPFCGNFQRSDRAIASFPADAQGQSTGLYFWSQDDSLEDLQNLAKVWKEKRDEVRGRLKIVGLNVDELPDAGEKTLRHLGLKWPALHLPGGRKNPHFVAFARRTPAIVTLSPTGYAAFYMAGASRKSSGTTSATRDYHRWVQSSLARSWTQPRYVTQTASILTGDFLIVDPSAPFDPALPPELKAQLPKTVDSSFRLNRSNLSVPEASLQAIQKCFVPPPFRYRLTIDEIEMNYLEAEKRCAAAMKAHPAAPDLWIVHNRRIIANLGLWKLTNSLVHFQQAVDSAQQTLTLNPPPGAEVIARFCLARQALREPNAEKRKVIEDFVAPSQESRQHGPILAAAAILALDAGQRELHESLRAQIIEEHLDHPMMWTFGNFLLNRYQRYQLFRAPFVSGRSFGWRQDYALSFGAPEEAQRNPEIILPNLKDKLTPVVPPSSSKWTILLINGQPVADQRAPLFRDLAGLLRYAEQRLLKDLRVVVALTTGEDEATRSYLAENPLDCPTVIFPGGSNHPLINQLGVLSEDETTNLVILRPDGSIARVASGLSMQTKAQGRMVINCLEWHDEQTVLKLLKAGRLEEAKELIFTLAPPPPPNDPKESKKQPVVSLPHLRSRARVYLAMSDLEKARTDAKAAVRQKTLADAGMSIRTEELTETEALLKQIEEALGSSRR
jgi:hypothetical protein